MRLLQMLLLVIIATVELRCTDAKAPIRDLYASSGELTTVFKMEQEMVQALAKHKEDIEEQLSVIREYQEEVNFYTYLMSTLMVCITVC